MDGIADRVGRCFIHRPVFVSIGGLVGRPSKSAWRQWGTPAALLGVFVVADMALSVAYRGIGLLEFPYKILSLVVVAIQILSLSWLTLIVAGRLADGFFPAFDGTGGEAPA